VQPFRLYSTASPSLGEGALSVVAPLDVSRVGSAVVLSTSTAEHTARAEVRLTTEGAENVSNVVGRLDTLGKGAVPAHQNTLDNLNAGVVDVLDRGGESSLGRKKEVVIGRGTRRGAIKVRGLRQGQCFFIIEPRAGSWDDIPVRTRIARE
jgi:hypothetical protein